MAICCVEPHPNDPAKEVHLYKCKECGLQDRIISELE
jgi:hypothetical protein